MRRANDTAEAGARGPGALLQLVRDGATTRAELVERTGLARSTVSQRVDALLAGGLLVAARTSSSTGGRPPTVLAFNAAAGAVLAADLGWTRFHAAVTDLEANVLAEVDVELAVADGPDVVLPAIAMRFDELLAQIGRQRADVRGVGVGLPAPVEFATGTLVRPPTMPGWHDVAVAERLREELGAEVLVDNDVNVMALGEQRLEWPTTEHLLFVKASTGVGCGLVANGVIYRGADGAAGELGHVRAPRAEGLACTCGSTGCLEAIAGGVALTAQLAEAGVAVTDVHEIAALLRAGDPTVAAAVRQAGRDIGDVLASIVNFFNPAVVVFGGELADASEDLLAGVREVVFQRSLPLATHRLAVVHSAAGARAGVVGAAVMALEHVLAPGAVDEALLALA